VTFCKECGTVRGVREKLIKSLWENHPYPADIFVKEGKEARLGYEVAIETVKRFFEEMESDRRAMTEKAAQRSIAGKR